MSFEAERRISRIVIQEAGIQGPPGGLETTVVLPPLEYEIPTKTLQITPTPSPNQVYRWNGTDWEAVTLPNRYVEHRLVTLAEATAQQIQLLNPVTDSSKILFDIADGGGPQFLGSDYELLGTDVISWEGLSLDGIVEEGDRIRIVYE